jgi:hypothetical protein
MDFKQLRRPVQDPGLRCGVAIYRPKPAQRRPQAHTAAAPPPGAAAAPPQPAAAAVQATAIACSCARPRHLALGARWPPFCRAATAGSGAPAAASADPTARYPVLLAILLKLMPPAEAGTSDSQQAQPAATAGDAAAGQAAAAAAPAAGTAAERFEAFAAAQPCATAVPFISWVASLEARAGTPAERAALAALCERLVVARERGEVSRLDRLYATSLSLLAGGDEDQVGAASGRGTVWAMGGCRRAPNRHKFPRGSIDFPVLVASRCCQGPALPRLHGPVVAAHPAIMSPSHACVPLLLHQVAMVKSDPARYALSLAEAVNGGPVVREGYGPAYDALLAVAPPVALTPEGIAKAHEEVGEGRPWRVGGERHAARCWAGRTDAAWGRHRGARGPWPSLHALETCATCRAPKTAE